LRAVDEPEPDVQPPLHSARVPAHDTIGGLRKPEQLEQVADARVEGAPAHALDPTLQRQVFPAGGVAVDARALGHVADRAADRVRLADDVVARDLGAARIRLRQRREDLDGGRLPGSVRAKEAEDLAGADAETDAVERLNRSVPLPDLVDGDRVHADRV